MRWVRLSNPWLLPCMLPWQSEHSGRKMWRPNCAGFRSLRQLLPRRRLWTCPVWPAVQCPAAEQKCIHILYKYKTICKIIYSSSTHAYILSPEAIQFQQTPTWDSWGHNNIIEHGLSMDAASLWNKVAILYFDIDDDEESIYPITIGSCVLNLNIMYLYYQSITIYIYEESDGYYRYPKWLQTKLFRCIILYRTTDEKPLGELKNLI